MNPGGRSTVYYSTVYYLLENIQTGSVRTQPSLKREADELSVELKRPEPEAGQSLKPSVEVQNKWSCNCNPTTHGKGHLLLLAALKGTGQDGRRTP
jgi:hypothetical protein